MQLDYIVPLGIPYSEWLGRVAGPDQPRWTDDDRALALEYQRWLAEACPQCRTRDDDWRHDRDAWIGQQKLCPGCQRLHEERENVPDEARDYVHPYLAPRVLLGDDLTGDIAAIGGAR